MFDAHELSSLSLRDLWLARSNYSRPFRPRRVYKLSQPRPEFGLETVNCPADLHLDISGNLASLEVHSAGNVGFAYSVGSDRVGSGAGADSQTCKGRASAS